MLCSNTYIWNMFCRKKNHDEILEDFYGLLSIEPSTFLHYTEGLALIEIPDSRVGVFKIARCQEEAINNPTQLVRNAVEIDVAERGPFLISVDILF